MPLIINIILLNYNKFIYKCLEGSPSSLLLSGPQTSLCRVPHQSKHRPEKVCFKVYCLDICTCWVTPFHLHKFHDKHEFISLQENILEVDQVGVDQFSHHLKEVHNVPNTSNHAKRFSSCAFVVAIVAVSDQNRSKKYHECLKNPPALPWEDDLS